MPRSFHAVATAVVFSGRALVAKRLPLSSRNSSPSVYHRATDGSRTRETTMTALATARKYLARVAIGALLANSTVTCSRRFIALARSRRRARQATAAKAGSPERAVRKRVRALTRAGAAIQTAEMR